MTTPPTAHEKLAGLFRSFLEQARTQFAEPMAEHREELIDRALASVAAACGIALSLRQRSRRTEDLAHAWLNTAVRLWTRQHREAEVITMPEKRA